ncbi:ABC transporter ATP-binding protein [Halalkalibacter urbisdiaboli]|uniref:ABC transporter ATP-binding protein n=1 Tax=Halalkalibacter urbisdiaboli TaxID=1960589 RepID=UPI000B436A2F|nr:ABC transporter ATP-binding protein [Halalkalibacter urbisdiaboli]
MSIEFVEVTKKFGTNKALRNLNLTLEKNKIYGLLGKNGAGKTTLMQILAGHVLPSNGKVFIDGSNPFNNRSILSQICLVNESQNFKRRLKIKEVLKIASLFYPNWSEETATFLLEQFHLDRNMNTKGLSKGMESALGITVGLASRANFTIFDEPYIGLDASSRYRFYELLLEEYEQHPRTIILSTHLIDEVSNLFEEVVILKKGELLLQKELDELIELNLKVSGNKAAVDQFIKGKHILHETEIAGRKTAILFGDVYSIADAKACHLEAERCPIQQLMVYLTEESGGEKYV